MDESYNTPCGIPVPQSNERPSYFQACSLFTRYHTKRTVELWAISFFIQVEHSFWHALNNSAI